MLRLALAAAFWCVATVFLWGPGIGNVSVNHIHYFKEAFGVLGYYSRETHGAVTEPYKFHYLSLAVTVFSSLLVSGSLLYEFALYRRNQQETKRQKDSPLWDSDLDQTQRRSS
jgi:hypothetical protein